VSVRKDTCTCKICEYNEKVWPKSSSPSKFMFTFMQYDPHFITFVEILICANQMLSNESPRGTGQVLCIFPNVLCYHYYREVEMQQSFIDPCTV